MMRARSHAYVRSLTVCVSLLAAVSIPRPAHAQWSTAYHQFYRQASHNWEFRRNYPAADRLFNAFDYGHAILYETLLTEPKAPTSRLEQREYDFITQRLLVKPPRLPLEESVIEVEYAKLVPEAKEMFEWAHVLHRQVYDIWADERLSTERKDREVNRLLKHYLARRNAAFSTRPKDMHLMEGQPYSLAFRRRYPKFNGLIWAYHWLQVGLYEPLVTAKSSEARRAGVDVAIARFRAMLADPPRSMPTIMPMTAAVAPEFSRRYPEIAIIFDNLHAMHDVISDVLADSAVPQSRKRAEILRAVARYRDDTSSVTTVAEWRDMAEEMGVEHMGGRAVMAEPPPPTLWTSELVERRLRDANIEAHPLPPTGRHIFMTIPARTYELVGGDELQVFLYPDSASRVSDTSKLDKDRVAPPNMMIKWRAQPSLVIDGNLAAIIITNDEARRQKVRDALSPLDKPNDR
jgi:hypothetical protein